MQSSGAEDAATRLVPGVGGRRHHGTRFTEVVATHTSRASPCLMAWSRYIQDETELVRYEGCDMGEIVPREKRAEEAVTAWSMVWYTRAAARDGTRREGGRGVRGEEEEDKKPPGRTGQQECYCKVTVGMGSLSMSESRANGC